MPYILLSPSTPPIQPTVPKSSPTRVAVACLDRSTARARRRRDAVLVVIAEHAAHPTDFRNRRLRESPPACLDRSAARARRRKGCRRSCCHCRARRQSIFQRRFRGRRPQESPSRDRVKAQHFRGAKGCRRSCCHCRARRQSKSRRFRAHRLRESPSARPGRAQHFRGAARNAIYLVIAEHAATHLAPPLPRSSPREAPSPDRIKAQHFRGEERNAVYLAVISEHAARHLNCRFRDRRPQESPSTRSGQSTALSRRQGMPRACHHCRARRHPLRFRFRDPTVQRTALITPRREQQRHERRSVLDEELAQHCRGIQLLPAVTVKSFEFGGTF